MLEQKSFSFEVKATGDNTFEGYASVFGNVDSHNDIIEKGAFSKTVKENKRVKFLWQHDVMQPIGRPTEMVEDSKGLHVKGIVAPTTLGKDALILMKEGVLDELSIGFNTVKDSWDKEKGIRFIKEVKLWEFSLVTFASNDQATLSKSAEMLNQFERGLKHGTFTREQIEGTIKALTALLSPTEPPKSTLTDEEKAAEQIKQMIQEMKNYAIKH